MVESTWRKEPELAALRDEFKELDRKIQLSLKPIEESEGQPVNEVAADKKQSPEDNRQPSQINSGQPYIPARLREIADNSGGRVVIAGAGSGNTTKPDAPTHKGIKL